MPDNEEKIKNIKNNLTEFDLRNLNLANFSLSEETKFHNYIKSICQRLLGNTLNLDQENIIFALSDREETNAAHVSKDGKSGLLYEIDNLRCPDDKFYCYA